VRGRLGTLDIDSSGDLRQSRAVSSEAWTYLDKTVDALRIYPIQNQSQPIGDEDGTYKQTEKHPHRRI
jgi:hypothetical protein